jgi:hypothetical protein
VLFLEQEVLDDPFQLDMKKGVAVRYFDRLHGELNVLRTFVNNEVPVEEFVPHVLFGGVFPFSVYFHNAAAGTTNPWNVLWNSGQHRSCSEAGFAHPVAVKRRVCTADQAKLSAEMCRHAPRFTVFASAL